MSKWTKRVSGLEYEKGGTMFRCDAIVKGTTEENYGSDADGNHGVVQDFIDEVILENIEFRHYDLITDDLSNWTDIEASQLHEDIYARLEDMAVEARGTIDE